ncbi:MAG: PH domain-containing protein [Alkalilacustris sp.]
MPDDDHPMPPRRRHEDLRCPDSVQGEHSVWSIHPSWRPILPSMLIGASASIFLILNATGLVQGLIDVTSGVIPWTQRGVDIVFEAARIMFLLPFIAPVVRVAVFLLTTYELTSQRLILHHGLFPRRHDEIALHRIRDRVVKRSLVGMLLGYGTVRMVTRDPSFPVVRLRNVTAPYRRSEQIRSLALRWKAAMGYREFDSGALS